MTSGYDYKTSTWMITAARRGRVDLSSSSSFKLGTNVNSGATTTDAGVCIVHGHVAGGAEQRAERVLGSANLTVRNSSNSR